MPAYDYDNQTWVEGDRAINVRRQQLTEELALLSGPRGADYLRWCGRGERLQDAITACRTALETTE